jgi:starch-binding outer membrane protein, SusD/RagB family
MNRKSLYHISIAVAFIVLLFSAGCSEDYLEKPKGGTVTVDTIFHTKNQANMAIAQMYSTCIYSYFTYNSSNSGRPEVITDEVYLIHGVHDSWVGVNQNTSSYVTGNMGTETPCDWSVLDHLNDAFASHYNGIRHANLVLENINKVTDADEAWVNDVKAQAIFCRAIQHYELFRYYGGVPIVNHTLIGSSTTFPARASVQSIVDSIVSWCDRAASILPETRPISDYGKVTKLTALALKARVLLYAASPLYNTPDFLKSKVTGARFGDNRDSVLCYPDYSKERWKLAADAAKAVLDNVAAAGVELYISATPKPKTDGTYLTFGDTYLTIGDYESVWNVYGNKEIIFLSTYQQYPNSSFRWDQYVNSKAGAPATWGVKNNTPVEFMQLYEKRDGTKWTLGQKGADLPDTIWNLNLDPRFYSSICYDGMRYNTAKGQLNYYRASADGTVSVGNLASSDAGVDGFAMETFKFCARIENTNRAHFAWPVFRLAEFYLSYAEALNEYYDGPTTEAYNAINAIRKRAGMPDKSGLDQTGFRDAIQNERTIELAFEGQRYNDLLRWLKAPEVLNQDLHGIMTTAKMVGGVKKRTWQTVFFLKRVFPQRYFYVPFKNAELSKNYLGGEGWNGQNPGW